jgi:hypothetical protein
VVGRTMARAMKMMRVSFMGISCFIEAVSDHEPAGLCRPCATDAGPARQVMTLKSHHFREV